jgi:5-formyltetrahydrofolate cyclo-ligase
MRRISCIDAMALAFSGAHVKRVISQMAEIYQREFAELALDTSMQTCLPVLTMRKVRETLRQQHDEDTRMVQRTAADLAAPKTTETAASAVRNFPRFR